MLQRKISRSARYSRAKSAKEFIPSIATWDIQTETLRVPVTIATSGSFERLELTVLDEREVGDGTVLAEAAAQSTTSAGPLAMLRNPIASSQLPQIELHVIVHKLVTKDAAATNGTAAGTDPGSSQEIVLVSNEQRLACEQLIHAKFVRCTATFVRADGMMEVLKKVPCGSACGIRFSLQTTHSFSPGDIIQLNLTGFSVKKAPVSPTMTSEEPITRVTSMPRRRRSRVGGATVRRRSTADLTAARRRMSATWKLDLEVLTGLNGKSEYLGTSASWDPGHEVCN